MTDYTVAVLEDSLHILEILNTCPDGLTLADLTTATGFVKNKVFRILYTLEKHHIVQRNEVGFYQLGYRLLELSNNVQIDTLLIDISRPVMKDLVRNSSESVFLGVVNGRDAVCIAAEESPQSIRLFAQVGRRTALHSGGVPKVLLAFMSDKEQKQFLNEYFTDNVQILSTGLTRPMLIQQIAEIQAQGYAIIIDELDLGAHSIAAPIRNQSGEVVAAISIAGPSNRFPEERIKYYVQLIIEASDQISAELGYSVPQPNSNGVLHSI
ncbi:MAG: IclR family transcriptional regulator [Anaerolineae bacterium]|nr:IclR family transcriptional regulator [Anaerolineae bacterium]